MKQTFDYFRANPAGNITGFVVWPVFPGYREAYTKAIMEQIDSEVEQVGFISPSYDGPPLRMDMMGGEFCANATRAYGYYAATFLGEKGYVDVEVYVSGIDHPLMVRANLDEGTSYVELPAPVSKDFLEVDGSKYKVYELSGISHLIVDDRKEDEAFMKEALELLKTNFNSPAYGILLYNKEDLSMTPYVYVEGSQTLIRESSCASGTVALAQHLNKDMDESFTTSIKQPNGILEVITRKVDDEIYYTIGGKVDISEVKKVTIEIPAEEVKRVKEKYKKEKIEVKE
ncbi:MAG: hypothetical protein ACTHWZ_03435 [Peptoniphilaceae bacterium]